jgi:hypothetical protein
MKKIILLCTLVIFLTGCTSINTSSIDSILNETLSSTLKITNTQRNGYSYYLPRGLILKNTKSFNEKLEDDLYQYYLYVDVVSYNNKTKFKYTLNNKAYFSSSLENNGKFGYVEINNYKNNQYLIEIMYNYAKIEVVVYEKDIKNVLANAMTIISSISYNDNIIINYLSSSSFEGNEEVFNIFEIVGRKDFLQVTDEETQEEENRDPDFIN